MTTTLLIELMKIKSTKHQIEQYNLNILPTHTHVHMKEIVYTYVVNHEV